MEMVTCAEQLWGPALVLGSAMPKGCPYWTHLLTLINSCTNFYVVCDPQVSCHYECLFVIIDWISIQFVLLWPDMLSKEPPWCEGDFCLECTVKFGIKTRKHHWWLTILSCLFYIVPSLCEFLSCEVSFNLLNYVWCFRLYHLALCFLFHTRWCILASDRLRIMHLWTVYLIVSLFCDIIV